MNEQRSKYRYQLYSQEYLNQFLSLWSEHTEWGVLSEEKFLKDQSTPYGERMITLMIDENDIIKGYVIQTPSMVWDGLKYIRAIRSSAPTLHSELRLEKLNNPMHPIWELCAMSLGFAANCGYNFVYSYPNPAWTRFLKMGSFYGLPDFQTQVFSYYRFKQPIKFKKESNLETRIIGRFEPRHEELWEKSLGSLNQKYAIKRSVEWLNYRTEGLLITECFVSGELIGFAVFIQKSKILHDLVALDEDYLPLVLNSSLQFINEGNLKNIFPVIKFLGTQTLIDATIGHEIEPINYAGSFVFAFISNDDIPNHANSIKWYLTTLD